MKLVTRITVVACLVLAMTNLCVGQTAPKSGNLLIASHLGIDEVSPQDFEFSIQTIPWPKFVNRQFDCGDIVFHKNSILVMLIDEKSDDWPVIARYRFSKKTWDLPAWLQPEKLPRTHFGAMRLVGDNLIVEGRSTNFQVDLINQVWYRLPPGYVGVGTDKYVYLSGRKIHYYFKTIDPTDGSLVSDQKTAGDFPRTFLFGPKGRVVSKLSSSKLTSSKLTTNRFTTDQTKVLPYESPQGKNRRRPPREGLKVDQSRVSFSVCQLDSDTLIWSLHDDGILVTTSMNLSADSLKQYQPACWAGPICVVK